VPRIITGPCVEYAVTAVVDSVAQYLTKLMGNLNLLQGGLRIQSVDEIFRSAYQDFYSP
jgi:hypothetical protein